MTTPGKHPELGILRPCLLVVFLTLAGCWLVGWAAPESWWQPWHLWSRLGGYLAALAMLVPYLHVLRSCFRHRPWGNMTCWLRWHVGAAYLGFFFVLVHSRGHANGPFTFLLLCLTWAVMLSGVAGYYGQKVLYRLLPKVMTRELGPAGLPDRGRELRDEGRRLAEARALDKAPPAVPQYCEAAVRACLDRPFTFWRRALPLSLSENAYALALQLADEGQAMTVQKVHALLQERQQLDLEYRLHVLGRLWLLVHGPASAALFVLMGVHIVMSWRFGGF
jgi:hypothetical protein